MRWVALQNWVFSVLFAVVLTWMGQPETVLSANTFMWVGILG